MGENRKDNRQIKFRVSDHEYEELEQTANNFHMSVPAFAKKRALGYRMKPPKVDKSGAIEIAKQLRAIGNNVNQLTKRAMEAREKIIAGDVKVAKRRRISIGKKSIKNARVSEDNKKVCRKNDDEKRLVKSLSSYFKG